MSGLSRMARSADYQSTLLPAGEAGENPSSQFFHGPRTLSHFALVMMPVEMRRLFNDLEPDPVFASELEDSPARNEIERQSESPSSAVSHLLPWTLDERRSEPGDCDWSRRAHRASSVRCHWVRIDPRVVFGRLSPGLANGETVSRAGSFGPRGR
jgi:hypothetical protein